MKQLTGLDATFLHLETGAQFGHVSGLSSDQVNDLIVYLETL